MLKNRSGQFVYFSLIATQSGTAVTGSSGFISGRKSLDGLSGMIVLSGNIIELGGGSYRANLYSEDTNGDQVGFLFTASGCVPVQYQFDMVDGSASGRVYLASGQAVSLNSGQSTLVYSGQLSGRVVDAHVTRWKDFSPVVTPNVSGVPVVDVMYASGQAVYNYDLQLASGSSTTITLPDTLVNGVSISGNGQYEYTEFEVVGGTGQGQVVLTTTKAANDRQYNVLSGTMIKPCDNTSQMVIMGAWRVASGSVYLASGHQAALYSGQLVSLYSGSFSGQPAGTATVASGQVWLASGQATYLYSGQSTLVYSGQLSGQQVSLLSGNTIAVLSGTSVNVFSGQLSGFITSQVSGTTYVASGTVASTVASGTLFLASGQAVSLNSGQSVLVYSGQLSGQQVNLISGNTVAVLSGTNVNLFSGTQVKVYSGQLSGHQVSLLSGTQVRVYSGQLSGYDVTSLTVSDKSGYTVGTNLDKSGYGVGSGDVYVASGTVIPTILSGSIFLASGQAVNILSGNTVSVYSGTSVNTFSGRTFLNSGFHHAILLADQTQFIGFVASGISGRCLLTAVRKLTNKWDLSSTSGYFTSYQEDDSSISMQQAVTAVSGAVPIVSMDTR